MADETIDRVINDAALAKHFETKINERASLANIEILVERAKRTEETTNDIAFDTDGVPYLTIEP